MWALMMLATATAVTRPAVVRDVEGYAVATCLARQRDATLRAQGEGWSSAIVQRGRGDVLLLRPVQRAVELEVAKGGMAVIRQDGPGSGDLALPVMFCAELAERAPVRAAIGRAVAALGPAYRRR